MTHRRLFVAASVLLLTVLLTAASLAAAQSPEPTDLRIDSISLDSYPAVEATVTVLDSNGVPIPGLPMTAFAASIGGESVPVTSATGAADDAAGISVVLVFDVSGSMAGLPLDTAKTAGKALIDQLHENDLVAVISFGDAVTLVQPFTNDRDALAAGIDALVSAGNTALYEAVSGSLQLATGAATPRRAVVFLSDGTDFGGLSTVTREESLAAAGGSSTPMFVTGLGEFIDPAYLEELASVSSGELSIAPDPASLQGLYERIGSVLRHQYVIAIDGSGLELDGIQTLRLEASTDSALAVAERPIDVPVPPAPPVVVIEEPPVEIAEPPVVEAPLVSAENSSGVSPAVFVGAPALIVGLSLAGFVLIRRRRKASTKRADQLDDVFATMHRRAETLRSNAGNGARQSEPAHDLLEQAGSGRLLIPINGDQQSLVIDGNPLTIGFSSDCDVVLPHTNGTAVERVRVWRRDGRFMLHNLSRGDGVRVDGKPVSWVVLEDGDEIELNGSRLTFQAPVESNGDF